MLDHRSLLVPFPYVLELRCASLAPLTIMMSLTRDKIGGALFGRNVFGYRSLSSVRDYPASILCCTIFFVTIWGIVPRDDPRDEHTYLSKVSLG